MSGSAGPPLGALWVDLWAEDDKKQITIMISKASGGGRGVRTHHTVSRIHAFQACAFSHSAIPPFRRQLNIASWRPLREATGRGGATTGQPMQLPVAQAVHQRFFLPAVDLDHGAVDEEREVGRKERHEIGDFL